MTEVFSRAQLEEPTLVFLIFETCGLSRLFPCNPGKSVERDSAPAQACSRCAIRIFNPHMHKDFVIALELTNLSQGHVVGKSDKTCQAIASALQRAQGCARCNQKERQSEHHNQNQQTKRNQRQTPGL